MLKKLCYLKVSNKVHFSFVGNDGKKDKAFTSTPLRTPVRRRVLRLHSFTQHLSKAVKPTAHIQPNRLFVFSKLISTLL